MGEASPSKESAPASAAAMAVEPTPMEKLTSVGSALHDPMQDAARAGGSGAPVPMKIRATFEAILGIDNVEQTFAVRVYFECRIPQGFVDKSGHLVDAER